MDIIRYMCTCAKCSRRNYSAEIIRSCADCGGNVVSELIDKDLYNSFLDQEELIDNFAEEE